MQSEYKYTNSDIFDARLYRVVSLSGSGKGTEEYLYPYYNYGTFAQDWYETPASVQKQIEYIEATYGDATLDGSTKEQIEALKKKKKNIEDWLKSKDATNSYFSFHSLIHPYAIVRLAGATGNQRTMNNMPLIDKSGHRRFYEIDGGDVGGYAKIPTTTALIKWGNSDAKGRVPYSFQDFVFCKHWNKIENNRLITLRRYAAPVTDSIDFSDYDVSEKGDGTLSGTVSKKPFSPLATAITYFGDDTGNKLSDILSFSAKYNWKKIGDDRTNPIEISSQQTEATDIISDKFSGVTSGLSTIARVVGFLSETQTGNTIDVTFAAGNCPPDPYNNGPYENRILGPINVITDTYKRERGLKFTGDGLKITFNYVSRPIGGINNKAIMLDLLANMLALTYSSGSWFGGMWKYKCEHPNVYPFKYGDAMNELYKGNIFGRNGAAEKLTNNFLKEDMRNYATTFLPDAASMFKNMFSAASNFVNSLLKRGVGDDLGADEAKAKAKESYENLFASNTMKAIEKVIAAKAIKGKTIPYIQNQRALLTGDPVGDWHLTVGNPLNPIAMIGNLIVDNVDIKFSDELGPDDFPIGFTAVVSLKHGLGRDRDAIESMFNRGMGRIYTLPDTYRSSADGETKVDAFTGGVNSNEGRTAYNEVSDTYFGGGRRAITKIQQNPLMNSGTMWDGKIGDSMIKPINVGEQTEFYSSVFVATPWQIGMTM